MKSFNEYLHEFNEVGEVRAARPALVTVTGLPRVRMSEVVMTEAGELGQTVGLLEDQVEVLMLTGARLKLGTKLVRTGEVLSINVSDTLLGNIITPLGAGLFGGHGVEGSYESRPIDIQPLPIERRENIWDPLETGVAIVDLLVPLGKGQRELVMGDRKIGKTLFIKQAMVTHARSGGVCVYGGIARRITDVLDMRDYLKKSGVDQRTVIVTSLAADAPGLVYITPYVAMTLAEYLRDKGLDVLIVLDDLTIHAKYYREIGLLSNRYPGRSAYPGDVFFTHARLMERAGKYDKGSITCLPMAETVLSDIRGYIQTNLMSMTDGHIFFDHELYNAGRRPPINPFLSVTRVGHQTRSGVLKDLSQQVTGFLVHYERLKKLIHFGGELSGDVKKSLAMGDLITAYFDQGSTLVIPLTVNALFMTTILGGWWDTADPQALRQQVTRVVTQYQSDTQVRTALDSILTSSKTVTQLMEGLKRFQPYLAGKQTQLK